MTDVRAVFFDAVETLIHPEPAVSEVYSEVGFFFGSRLPPAAVMGRFRHFFGIEEEEDRRSGLTTSEERERCRWQNIVAGVLDDVADPVGCFTALYEHFGRPTAWRCDPAAEATLERLAKRGYQIGLASNFDHRLRTVVQGLPELRQVQHLVISSEIGWRKPAPEIFDAVCESVQLPPEAILFVGNDRLNDFDGANRAGLRALLLDPLGQQGDLGFPRLAGLEDFGAIPLIAFGGSF